MAGGRLSGTAVGTRTWGRLHVLDASFMAFRMLPEEGESLRPAKRPGLGEGPCKRYSHP